MKIKLITLFILFASNAFAQQPYVLSNLKSNNYTPITGTSITSNLDDTTIDLTLYFTPTGYSYFPFIYMGRENHAIKINSNGIIKFVSGDGSTYTEADLSEFVILGADLIEHKTLPSKIVYNKVVTTNDVTLNIEWQNMSFKKDTSRLSFVNFKVSISTSSGSILLQFGTSSGVDSSYFINNKPVIQLFRCDSVNNLTLQGNPKSPIITSYQKDIIKTLTSMPDTGRIYNFASPFAFSGVYMYPHHIAHSSLVDLGLNFEYYSGAYVDVDYTINNGLTWNPLSKVLNTGSLRLSWNIPDNMNAQNFILRLNNGTYQAYLMDTLQIINPALSSLTFTNPTSGKILKIGDTAIVSWNSVNLGYSVRLYFSADSGQYWNVVAYQNYDNKEGINTYKFIPNYFESTTCLLKAENDIKNGISAPFTITLANSALKLTSFNTGGIVYVNDIKDISFQVLNVPKINLFYSANNGVTWKQIDTNISTATSYSWHIPNDVSTKCLVKIKNASDTSIYSIAAVVFTIAKSAIKLTSLNTGGTVYVGDIKSITFQVNNISKINLYYSTNNGGTWKPIASNVSTATPYAWQVPDDVTTQGVIKVEDASDASMFAISATYFFIEKKPNTGIAELLFNEGKHIWPTPVTDGKLHVSQPLNLAQIDYLIIDLLGRKIKSGFITGKESVINIEELNKGIYFIIFDTDKSSTYQKLIIE